LGAAAVQDRTTVFGRHTGAETVAAGANDAAGLEWAFHGALRRFILEKGL
jgi:hypothetical protein